MIKYLKFSVSSLVTMCLFAGVAFWDCAPLLSINIHMLPDSMVGLFIIIYTFVVARAAATISQKSAMFLLFGIAFYVLSIIFVSKHYCNY
jgi:hypothetical protein